MFTNITIILDDFYHESISAMAKVIPTSDEKKVLRVENDAMNRREKERENSDDVEDIVMPDRIPQIEFRNIIGAPTYCPSGEKMDSIGRCRKVMYVIFSI